MTTATTPQLFDAIRARVNAPSDGVQRYTTTDEEVRALFDALATATAERDAARAVCELLAGPDSNPAVMVAAARTEAQRLVAENERLRAELAEAREMACADGECGKCHYCTDAVAWNDNLRAANAERDLAQAQADDFAAQRDRACAALAQMREALKACRRAMQNDWHNKPRIGMERECALADAALSSPPDEWLAKQREKWRAEWDAEFRAAWDAEHPMTDDDHEAEKDAADELASKLDEARRERDAEWAAAIATWNDPGAQHDFDIAKALSAFGDAWSQSHEALGARCDAYKELLAKEKADHAATANDLTEALKLRDKLREALTCWGVHDPGCPGKNEGPDYCTCGLAAARGGQR